jgi:hypothetical protein
LGLEVGSLKVGALEVGPAEVGLPEVGFPEGGALEVELDVRTLVPPLIPGRGPALEPLQEFLICHIASLPPRLVYQTTPHTGDDFSEVTSRL